jgi:hypothetical protein
MSGIQRLAKALLPESLSADMEAHSRQWKVMCQTCGTSVSIWDLGGIKYKAVGQSRTVRRCRKCGKVRWHIVTRDEPPAGT